MKKFSRKTVLLLFLFTLLSTKSFAKEKLICSKASPTNKNYIMEFYCYKGGEEDGDCWLGKKVNGVKDYVYFFHLYTSYETLPEGFSCDYHSRWSPDGKQFAFWSKKISLEANGGTHPIISVFDINTGNIRTFENGVKATLKPLKFFSNECEKKICSGQSHYFSFEKDGSLTFNILYLDKSYGSGGKGKSCYTLRKLDWIMMNFKLNNIVGSGSMNIKTNCK